MGLHGQDDPIGRISELIDWANRQLTPVLSLESPAGLDAETGQTQHPGTGPPEGWNSEGGWPGDGGGGVSGGSRGSASPVWSPGAGDEGRADFLRIGYCAAAIEGFDLVFGSLCWGFDCGFFGVLVFFGILPLQLLFQSLDSLQCSGNLS
jgi:YjeF-related protein N-terminus